MKRNETAIFIVAFCSPYNKPIQDKRLSLVGFLQKRLELMYNYSW